MLEIVTSSAATVEASAAEVRVGRLEYVEIGTDGDAFHTPARALYESLGCIKWLGAVYLREL